MGTGLTGVPAISSTSRSCARFGGDLSRLCMTALLALVLHAAPPIWDGRSPVEVRVGDTVTLAVPRSLRFVSVGGGDVVEVGVSRDLRVIHVRGLRRGNRTLMAHFQDRTRLPLDLKVTR